MAFLLLRNGLVKMNGNRIGEGRSSGLVVRALRYVGASDCSQVRGRFLNGKLNQTTAKARISEDDYVFMSEK